MQGQEAKKNPGLMFDLQSLGSLKNILELSRSKNFNNIKQIMLLSSSTVYGDFKEDTVDETVRPRPKAVYMLIQNLWLKDLLELTKSI